MSNDLTETKVSPALLALFERSFFDRACGECVCKTCGMLYFDHPYALEYLDWKGDPYLLRLCNGKLVKL